VTIGAEPLKLRQITVSGNLQTRGVTYGAWLLVEVYPQSGQNPLLFRNTFDDLLKGDSNWRSQAITLPVPPDADRVVIGMQLRGDGTATAQNVRITISEPLDPDGAIAPPARQVLDRAIAIVRTNALNRDALDGRLERDVRALASGASRTSDVYPAISYLLSSLRDNHSQFMTPERANSALTGSAEARRIELTSLSSQTAYLKVPGYSGGDSAAINAYTSRTHELIETAIPQARCGWIVDLREDDGGNVFPMLGSLKPFLGDGALGTSVGPDGLNQPRLAGENLRLPQVLASLQDAPVAVLLGPRTASAGEAVAIAFRGRAWTRSFGRPTGGQTTANRAFPLPDGSAIAVAIGVMTDRTGKKYGGSVDPEEIVMSNRPGIASSDDEVTEAAVRWLTSLPQCTAAQR
jgi:C-terminal processing protease CtpA/Prc